MRNANINKYELKQLFKSYIINSQPKKTNDSEQDQINKKIDILRMKVFNKHDKLSNEQRKQLKEKRLNTIFDKSNYYYIDNELNKNNEMIRNKNYSFLINEKANNNFLERYKELYGLSMNNRINNDNDIDSRIKKNMYDINNISYYINRLKSNQENNTSNDITLNNLSKYHPRKSQGKNEIKRKYNSLKEEIFDNKYNEKSKNDLFNSSMQNIRANICKNNNFLNTLLKTKNVININFIDNINNNKINYFSSTINNGVGQGKIIKSPKNNYFQQYKKESVMNKMLKEFNKISDSYNNNNYYGQYNYDRPISSSRIYSKKSNYNNAYKNIINNPIYSNKRPELNDIINKYLYNKNKGRVDMKLNNFKARLNLLSLK